MSNFEKWAENYGLRYEPNFSKHTEADCKAAYAAGVLEGTFEAQPAPQGVAEVMRLVVAHTNTVFFEGTEGDGDEKIVRASSRIVEQAVTAIVQELDALRAEKSGPYFGHYQQSLTKIARLDARVAELEGSVARDAARYKFLRHCDAPRLHRLIEVDGFEKFDRVIDAAIASAKEPSHD